METKAERLTKQQAKDFVEALYALHDHFPCEHGHIGCSATEGGPCMDEVLSLHPELAE